MGTSSRRAWAGGIGPVSRVAGLLATCAVVSGCQQVLFPVDAPRTQFELYDRLHNRYAPTEVPDAFGNPQPALRSRLSRRADA